MVTSGGGGGGGVLTEREPGVFWGHNTQYLDLGSDDAGRDMHVKV